MAPDIELIVFDWDGTLVDSLGAIEACTLHVLAEIGRPAPPPGLVRASVGAALDEVIGQLLPGGKSEDIPRLVDRYRYHWQRRFRHQTSAFPASRQVLDTLAARGLQLAVATGKSRSGLEHDLDATGFRPIFRATRTADDARPKPDPEMLLDLLDELDVAAERALMVGDTTFDMDMARAAGVAAVAVTTGHHDEASLRARGPIACLGSIAELPGAL